MRASEIEDDFIEDDNDLENNTEDPQIRKIIDIYNPYIRKEPDFMKAQILSL